MTWAPGPHQLNPALAHTENSPRNIPEDVRIYFVACIAQKLTGRERVEASDPDDFFGVWIDDDEVETSSGAVQIVSHHAANKARQ